MAHKLLAPFKKFPQQLPIFKKSSDKWKDISLSNYNSVYGMLDDVTSQSFDDELQLFALGTRRGEIKIYGSAGVVYTLVGSTLKSINFLRFLNGQGRLLSVSTDNDIVLWEYRVEQLNWEVVSTLSLGSLVPNATITAFDVSHPLSWKSNDDNLLQLLLIGMSNNAIRQVLIVGNRFHFYDGDDVTVDSEGILAKCQDLSKEYEFGEITALKFNSKNNDKFIVTFKNGLLLIMRSNVSEPKAVTEDSAIVKEPEEVTVEQVEEVKELAPQNEKVGTDEHQNGESQKDKGDEEKEKVESSTEQPEGEKAKSSDDSQKPEEVKVEVKKIKESVQVPFVSVKMPLILNYAIHDKMLNCVCWSDDDVVVNYQESSDISFYHESDVEGNVVEAHKTVTFHGDISSISNLKYFKRNDNDVFAFVNKTEQRSNLLCLVTGGHVDAELETPSNIIDYVIVKDQVTDENSDRHVRTLLVLCESQLVAIDLASEHYTELQCPYLVFRINSHVTAVTSIIQVSKALFSNHKTLNELFDHWPLKTPLISHESANEESLDILATGHSDGAINIWQVMSSGALVVLASVSNKDLFKNLPPMSNSITEVSLPRRKVGHHLINNEDTLLRINNIQLIHNSAEDSGNSVGNGLFCVSGNSSGTVFVFKYDRSETGNNLTEITSNLKDCHEKEDILWNDTDAPELLDSSEINGQLPNLSHIIKLNPSLPVTALAFQPQWNMLAVGCAYGLVLVDLKQNNTVYSYSTLARASKSSVVQAPLTVGQQLRKSMRQSFRKLKKLKPTSKHTYTVNDEKAKDKEEVKSEEPKVDDVKPEEVKSDEEEHVQTESDPKSEPEEIVPEKAEAEDKEKGEDSVKCAAVESEVPDTENEPPIEISRKDKPSGTVGSLLIEATNLVTAIKEPCLFVGTNIGAIYAFELKFDLNGSVTVTLSKELHLQHKAPVLLMAIVNSNHVPLVCTNVVSSYQRKWSVVEDKTEEVNDASAHEHEIEVGPSGDAEDQQDKLKAGTMPAPHKMNDEEVEKVETVRKSIDAGKEKGISTNTSMKKSGTLPASFLQAIGKSPSNAEAHELLVVSEEQVKLFSLPSLKAKYKYKVVDTGHHYGHTKSSNNQESEQNSQEKKSENVDSNNVDTSSTKKQIRRISTVGLCKVQGAKQTSNKWGVSIALTNGEIIALTLNNLKKYLSNLYNANCPILTSITNGEYNLVASMAHERNLQITDFSQIGPHHFEPLKTLLIPEIARPVVKVEEKVDLITKTDLPAEETKTDENVVTNGHKSEHMNGHAEANEIEEGKDQMGDEAMVQNPSTTHHGDVTMDSIKEYITNMDGKITVKTFESSTEKHITVNDGQIVTTVHEKQLKDGDVIKDETVKITSDTVGSNAITQNE